MDEAIARQWDATAPVEGRMIPASGDILNGRYRVGSTLGEGAFGVVLRAEELNSGRLVAIKILKPGEHGYDPKMEARFLREMRVVAKLQSPYTVKLFDFGRTEDGLLFMVCEYVAGEDLVQLIHRRERLEEHEALRILQQALLGIAEAHDLGILHRDIKPHNIRAMPLPDGSVHVKVLDFGLARPLVDDANLTATGKVVGTLRYMSPEQLYNAELTPSTDIYSLGIVACEMLLGREATKFQDYREISVEGKGLSGSTVQLLRRMTAIDPKQRYASAQEVLHDIQSILNGVTITSEEPTGAITPRVGPAPHARAPHVGSSATTLTRAPRETSGRRRLVALVAVPVVAVAVAIAFAVVTGADEQATTEQVESNLGTILRSTPVETPPEPLAIHDDGTGCGKSPGTLGLRRMQKMDGLSATEWLLYTPHSYDRTKPHPVVILFHNDGQTPGSFLDRTRFDELADASGVVLIVPGSGAVPLPWRERSTVELIPGFFEAAAKRLCLDRDRVFAVGHSTGAIGAQRLACEGFPLKAIALHAYRPMHKEPLCRKPKQLPQLILSPLGSRRIPQEGGAACSPVVHLSLDEFEAIAREENGCGTGQEHWFEGESGNCWSWVECAVPLSSCHIEGGVGWPGSGIPEFDILQCDPPAPDDISANALIWQFFDSLSDDVVENDRGQ